MSQYYLAVDIGASSGRHILGRVEDGKLRLEEVYRFENGMKEKNGHLCWDTEHLFRSILEGMRRCRELGKIPVSMGIDTWGVDFVLLDKEDRVIGDTVGYRDHRTDGMDEKVSEYISPEELYARTGIQKQIFNTIYQLMAIREQTPEQLERAECLLMMPDYFHYLLTGKKACEYTEATTGQLINPYTKDWDRELIRQLGYPEHIFQTLMKAGTVLGNLTEEGNAQIGFGGEG
ncbi:MAG: rhamnulokinase, partial [Lachnospiraceae bacterium]|nr:rhamnulokinase [Lachnospiraceae bacterium]